MVEDVGDNATTTDSGDMQERVEGRLENSSVSLQDSMSELANSFCIFLLLFFSNFLLHYVHLCTN